MNTLLAGLLAAVPLAILGFIYMWQWGDNFVTMMLADGETGSISPGQMKGLMTAGFVFAPFMFGLASGLIYGWIDDPLLFQLLAVGLAVVLSILAVLSPQPLKREKAVINFLVALNFGFLIPILTG